MSEPRDPEKSANETITWTEQDVDASLQKRRTARDKLGIWNIIVLSVGTILVLLPVIFLIWLWVVSFHALKGSGTTPILWELIATNEWTARVVTLCAILIRFATGAQLCIFAAILAALILERVGASSQDFPLLSMIRCANTGPQALIWYVFHTMKARSQLAYSSLIAITILNAFALQFTSTLLIGDLEIVMVVTHTTNDHVFYGLSGNSPSDPYGGVNFWKTGPQTYPRFAEYREPPSNGTNFTDTGKTYRGFLPFFTADTREYLTAYNGPLEIVDVRTVCVKPAVSEITLSSVPDDELGGYRYFITGNLSVQGLYPELLTTKPPGSDHDITSSPFNCSIPLLNADLDNSSESTSICLLTSGSGYLLNSFNENRQDETIAHLVMNATSLNWNTSFVSPNTAPLQQTDSPIKAWTRLANQNLTLDISMCFINPQPDYRKVSIWDDSNSTTFLGDTNPFYQANSRYGRPEFDAGYISWIFGTYNYSSPADRGMMTLDDPTYWESQPGNDSFQSILGSLTRTLGASTKDDSDITVQMSSFSNVQESIHPRHAAVVTEILAHKKDPALAIQTLWTILLQMAYYDPASNYDVNSPAVFTIAEKVQIPTRWKRFAVVMALLTLHLILISTAVFLFITRTNLTLLGNSWQAVSQVVSSDTVGTLHEGAMATDKEMKKKAKKSENRDQAIKIVTSETNGRMEAKAVVLQK